jgi:hypothetical protein
MRNSEWKLLGFKMSYCTAARLVREVEREEKGRKAGGEEKLET